MILARLSVALARLLFAPGAPCAAPAAAVGRGRRRGPSAGPGGIALTTIYGYYALEAGRQLGLPWTIHGFLLHLLFLVVALMLTMLIVRSREPVAQALASLAEDGHSRLVRRLPWRGLAGVWHLLAGFYVLLVFAVWALKIPGGFQLLFGATLGSALVLIACWLGLRLVDQLFGRDRTPGAKTPSCRAVGDRPPDQPLPAGRRRASCAPSSGSPQASRCSRSGASARCAGCSTEAGQNLLGRLLIVFAIVVVTIAVWEAISLAIERSISEQDEEGNLRFSNRTRTLLNIVRNFLAVFFSLIALFLILSELGLNIAPLLAGAGVIGLAIGFGSQKLVQDIITGLFVLLGDTDPHRRRRRRWPRGSAWSSR